MSVTLNKIKIIENIYMYEVFLNPGNIFESYENVFNMRENNIYMNECGSL